MGKLIFDMSHGVMGRFFRLRLSLAIVQLLRDTFGVSIVHVQEVAGVPCIHSVEDLGLMSSGRYR